ncbi:hypothetical protein PTNB85_07025 [Pyrenophora teres f. teres]|uniref:Short chain dehydrogenase n=1 Tax=Pyrenophora teres f. teres TaxID=97479 RepID=A0A6S6WF35_9PLEO|nr:hypothetical protein HRS9139_08286 [Pyrenophora teres f. teres]KAE8832633.1 hypothetical protein PTNB85_07025 [Pyrenophora teres f. teres]KAE8856294.1 hypothetical protein PTNB29_09133 [Pyrenophora teres f. teres]CAE7213639.1 short chain dehydrogenase [Pyrenophora teres f. teres]
MSPASEEMVVILSGASRGIGQTIAHHLLTHTQHNILVTARSAPPLLALESQYGSARVSVLTGDLADERIAVRAVEMAVEKWGRLDSVVVNHGSLGPVKRVGEASVGEWRRTFDGNVFGALGLIQASLPHLRRSSNPRIILTSSGASVTPYQSWGAYGAGKAVLNHLAATLAVEEPNITTISIRPGVVDTEMQREIREVHAESMSEKDREKFSGLKTSGGLLRPEQPGHVIAKLAVAEGDEIKGFSGRFLSWNDESLRAFQEE